MDTDSISDLDNLLPDKCVITLNILQHHFYTSAHIDICDPEGNRLESIGYGIKKDNLEISIYRLKEQIYLLDSLFYKLKNSAQLPPQAFSALGDLLYRMQGFCRDYIK